MSEKNEMKMEFNADSVNESFARVAVAGFLVDKNPTLDELADIKTAVSEAVTNAIIHGYQEKGHKVYLTCTTYGDEVEIVVRDEGIGIENIAQAMEPFFTTKPQQERSGMGFSFMEAFMDELKVESTPGVGTVVFMKKRIGKQEK